MPDLDVYKLMTIPPAATGEAMVCPPQYNLFGPQVEPETSWWLRCGSVPRPITETELLNALGWTPNPRPADLFPVDAPTLRAELQELIILARLRDEPAAIAHVPQTDDIKQAPQQLRLPLSMFWQLRPQPLGAVTNTARDGAFPVIGSGRELARYVENETPGLPFQVALDYMIRETTWSPPRQGWVWAALNVTLYSALAAAWFLKWRGGPHIERRIFDMVLTDPPYADMMRRPQDGEKKKRTGLASPTPFTADVRDLGNLPYEQFLDELTLILSTALSVLKPQGYTTGQIGAYRSKDIAPMKG